MGEEVGLRKKPVISIWCREAMEFRFLTSTWNPGFIHAKVLVETTVKVEDKALKIPPNNHYSGKRVWHVQAMGPNSPFFQGELNLFHILEHNDYEDIDPNDLDVSITIKSWAAGLEVDENNLQTDRYKNLTGQWDWRRGKPIWVQEIAPHD